MGVCPAPPVTHTGAAHPSAQAHIPVLLHDRPAVADVLVPAWHRVSFLALVIIAPRAEEKLAGHVQRAPACPDVFRVMPPSARCGPSHPAVFLRHCVLALLSASPVPQLSILKVEALGSYKNKFPARQCGLTAVGYTP